MPLKYGANFEAFVLATQECGSVSGLYDLLRQVMSDLGYDHVNFSVKRDDDLHEAHLGFGLYSTYPEDWQKYYISHDCIKIDPVLRCAISQYGPFKWADLERKLDLDRRQINFLRMGEEAGLNNGLGIPFAGARSQIAGIALATSDPRIRPYTNIDLLQAYANQFYTAYKRMVGNTARKSPTLTTLSEKEADVLRWIATGKTAHEVGERLSISHHTVNYHVRNIFTKLNLSTSIEAVLKAMDLDMIDL